MTRAVVCLLSALLLASLPARATPGSESVPKVLAYTSTIGSFPPATRDTLAWYDVLVCFDRPEHIAHLRLSNPDQRYLWALLPQYVESVTEEDPWWLPDTLWSIKRLLMYYAYKNDWYLYDVNGAIVNDGAMNLINWTEYCPVGTFGSSKGQRAAEWLASVGLPDIALSGRYWDPWSWDSRTAYNGYMFEILADCLGSYTWQNYQYADPDRDGDADGVYDTCSAGGEDDPLSVLFRAENEVFYDRLRQAFPPEFVFTIQGNWDFIGPWWLTRLSGIKLENWMRDTNPEWVDWWDHFYGLTPPWEGGTNHGGGYAWVERKMDKPVEDRLRGWDLSFIQVHRRDNVPESENERQMRWGLGTSMLGDGYFCYSIDQRLPLWPEEFNWDFGTAAGDYTRELAGSDTLYVRLFTKGMVEVNPHPYAVGGVEASDSRFTFWASVGDLAADARGTDRVEVRWTSPDGERDDPESFELRYAQTPITLENWDQAASYAGNPIPAAAGQPIAIEIGGLATATTYHVAVRGRYHGKLEAALSNPVTVTTWSAPDGEPPAAIADLRTSEVGDTFAVLLWTAPGDDGQAGRALRYLVRTREGAMIETEADWEGAAPADTSGIGRPEPGGAPESWTLRGLRPEASCGVAIRAMDDSGLLGGISNPILVTTASAFDLAPPEPPARAWIDGTDIDGRLFLAWEPSASPDVAGYHAYGRHPGEGWERLTTDPLPPGTMVWSAPPDRSAYGVSALDDAGNESAPRAVGDEGGRGVEVRGPFPHPIRSSCRFEILTPLDAIGKRLRVRIFDLNGSMIRTLVDEAAPSNAVPLFWDRRDDGGSLAAPGFYLLRAELGGRATHRRIYLDP